MRPSLIRLVRPRRPERKTSPLLPPLALYKRILRAHYQHLPQELRFLGDQYVKAEFKAHKHTDNPLHIVGFLTQWQEYLGNIVGDGWLEGKLKQQDLEKMSPEQVGQLYELMQETRKIAEERDS
ncbi:acetate non-utilizing protein 9 [Scheffersomyces spartinae]|uniref:Succinate dehydrogenase assembly factor 3 n=1 Tax=Scheffersomyces spartinae TaxID=45513 RepID=A0A9P8AH45_9ASCO|nr:acetate non-utilizing protein 9 [Scheffersomyces spartinae]KAG7191757.1 acetate non-utilizing protein 9 [Scheffersomyces spartinae]